MGALEEGGKAIGSVVDAMRTQPLAIALVLINLGLLVYLYYYTSRITARTETTAQALFNANDKLYAQFGTIVKDQNTLVEKAMHCILPEDALKLLQAPPRVQPQSWPPYSFPKVTPLQFWPPALPAAPLTPPAPLELKPVEQLKPPEPPKPLTEPDQPEEPK